MEKLLLENQVYFKKNNYTNKIMDNIYPISQFIN